MEAGPPSQDMGIKSKAESGVEDKPKPEFEAVVEDESVHHPHGVVLGLIIFTLCLAVFLCGLVRITTSNTSI